MKRWLYLCIFLLAAATLWGQGSAARLSKGLTVLANCTFAKLIDDRSDEGANPSNRFNFRSQRVPGNATVDFGMIKGFPIHERHRLPFRAGMFNLFNRVNLGGPNANHSAATFGRITGAGSPRVIQWRSNICSERRFQCSERFRSRSTASRRA